MTPIVEVGLVGPWVLVAGQSWLLYRLLRGQSRLLVHQQNLQDQLQDLEGGLTSLLQQASQPPPPPPLAIGDPAPEFSLPDLGGRERSLQDFLGQPLVLNFFSPACSFCLELAPRLGQLPENGPRVLVISHGDSDENLRLAKDHKWRCDVLLDSTGQVMQAYRAGGTPTGYSLDADGRVASELAVGADALLALITTHANGKGTLSAESLLEKQQAALERARQAGLSLTETRLNRQGLAPGVKAPAFTLPDLKGEKRSLASFLDKRVLLVFSDPNCGPCDALAPELVLVHQRHREDNLRVVMISRGDPEANRAKALEHRFPFPVLLQKQWEISKDYAMFATPVGYLIDPSGEIAKPVAVGRNAILALV
jgi:peroxiredoxin